MKMLKKIKSVYFIRLIFSYVDERQKLKIIKYNKNLQKNINIKIINYMHYLGRYIIYETDGIGKEYDGYDDKLRFTGQYSNGERNGEGYEIWGDEESTFDGEFLNGKRHGKGKEYVYYGRLFYEGEYLNGEKNGKGKEDDLVLFIGKFLNDKKWIGTGYDNNGNILYRLNNEKNGKGKEYDECGNLIYEGEYLNGRRNGKGKSYWESGEIRFEGEFLNDIEWNGKGYDLLNNSVDIRNGKCLMKEYNYFSDSLEYEGEYMY